MQLNDHHVHTRFSACCHERYDLHQIAKILDAKGFPYACVLDHVHQGTDGDFLAEHARVRNDLLAGGYPKPIFIGIEASIVDNGGHLVLNSVNAAPDYIVCSDHWIPGTLITMDNLQGSAFRVKEMHAKEPQKLQALYKDVASMYVNAIGINKIEILAHPFDTFMRIGNHDKHLLDVFGPVCEACQVRGVAIEINDKSVQRQLFPAKQRKPLHDDCMQPAAFYTALVKIAMNYDLLFSTGSDAHVVNDIGDLAHSRAFIEQLGIPDRKIFTLPSEAR